MSSPSFPPPLPAPRSAADRLVRRLSSRQWGWVSAAAAVVGGGAGAWWPGSAGAALGGAVLAAAPAAAAAGQAAQLARQKAVAKQARRARKRSDPLINMPWREFEVLVSDSFRLRGYRIVELIGGGPAHSFDLVLVRERRIVLAHCRPGTADRVADETVRELDARRAVRGAHAAVLVSAGRFSERAQRCARDRKISLLGGSRLRRQLDGVLALRRQAGRRDAPVSTQQHDPGQSTLA